MKKTFLLLAAMCCLVIITGCDNGNNPSSQSAQAVDLGLSVKWASCNIGASKPEESGTYFAWGETKSKSDYSWETYTYYNATTYLTKYNQSSMLGTVDNKVTLEQKDDAAKVVLQGKWRMPTMAEMQELMDQCTWTWTTVNSVNGYQVSASNGKSIFLPAAGSYDGSVLRNVGTYGNYWSSSLNETYELNAYGIGIKSARAEKSNWYRCLGMTIRPVCP